MRIGMEMMMILVVVGMLGDLLYGYFTSCTSVLLRLHFCFFCGVEEGIRAYDRRLNCAFEWL
jgi:hypothetical protein